MIDGYNDTKLDVPVLMTCHGLPVSEIFVPVILSRDTDSSDSEQRTGGEKLSSYKELFFEKDALQRKIFLLGKAGAGKSTFCTHVIDIWCSDKVSPQFDDSEVLKQQFRFLFSVSCRFAEASESIFDMICNQLFSENDEMIKVARQVLKNTPNECLVMVDGIDEWRGSASMATGRRGDIPGLPSRRGLENCVVLSTSRPERIHMLPTKLDKTCHVLELQGIQNTEALIRCILEEVESSDPVQSCSEFLSQVRQNNMTGLIQFPLMLINALNIWDRNGALSISMSVNYSNMVEGLFLRAKEAGRIEEHEQGRKKENSAELHDCFRDTDMCKQNAGLIIGLGKLAFDLKFRDNQNSSLIFSRQQSSNYLTELELETSLAIGILSKAQTFSKSSRKIESFSFCHKTFQEFLGALWLFRVQSEFMDIFLQQFKTIDNLYDNGVFLQFLCGLSPSSGDTFWRYIVEEVIEKDTKINECRLEDLNCEYKVQKVQDLVLKCIKEARNSDLEQHRQLYYFMPDIYISDDTDKGDITLINSLVDKYVTDIKSVTVGGTIPSNIFKFMKQMHSAVRIRIKGHFPSELPLVQFPHQLKKLAIQCATITSRIELPIHLTSLTVHFTKFAHNSGKELFSYLRSSSALQDLELEYLYCSDHGFGCCLPALDLQRHNSLEKVKLRNISVESVLLPGQGTLPLPLTRLIVSGSKLSHGSWKELFSLLRVSSTLEYLMLGWLYCSDHGDSCCLPALDLQRHNSLKIMELIQLSVESMLLPGQGTLPLHLRKLIVQDSTLSHSGWKELFSLLCVSSTLAYLNIERPYCSDHGDSCCLPALDLQRHNSLTTLYLRKFSVESVLLPGQGTLPLHLRMLEVLDITLSHSTWKELFSCLHVSSFLEDLNLQKLYCSDHGDGCCLPALYLQRHNSLRSVDLRKLSVESVLLPCKGTLPLQISKLSVQIISLSHSTWKELFSCLHVSSTLEDLYLLKLYCSDHGDGCCLCTGSAET